MDKIKFEFIILTDVRLILAGGYIFPLICLANGALSGADGEPDQNKKNDIDFGKIALKYQPNVDSDPAYHSMQQHRDQVGGEIFRSAYYMRDDFDILVSLKAFLDVYDTPDAPAFDHKMDALHLHLTDLVDTVLHLEQGCLDLSTGTLRFLPTDQEFSRRHSRMTLDEKRDEFLQLRYPQSSPESHASHPELDHPLHMHGSKSPQEIAVGFLKYITSGAAVFHNRIESLVQSLDKDVQLICRGRSVEQLPAGTSVSGDLLAEAKNLLAPQHLPSMLWSARNALDALTLESTVNGSVNVDSGGGS